MKNISIKNLLLLGLVVFASSCSKKLDLFPQNDLTSADVYSTAAGYRQVLAKVYGGLATTGNVGPAGASDIQGLDEGSQSPFLRGFFIARNYQRMKRLFHGMTKPSRISII